MKTKDIKKNINQEMDCLISSNFDSVVSKIEKKKGVIIEMENAKNKKVKVWGLSLSIAAVVILVVGIVGFNFMKRDTSALLATIILDVNPSVEIKVNKEEKVLEVLAHNEEAKKVIGDMELNGVDLDVATNAILGSMLKNGYLDEAKNSVLVTVVGADDTKNKEIQERVSGDIDKYFTSSSVEGSVMSQAIKSDEELETLAKKHGITIGKAELINKIVAANPMYTFEDLVGLSTTELNLLANSEKNNVTDVTTSGSASEKDYIGKDKAKEIVFNALSIKESQVKGLEIEFDYDNGIMVYDIEFKYDGYEYDYEVDAKTGKVIKSDKDKEFTKQESTDDKQSTQSANNEYITKEEAVKIALNHAGVAADYYDLDIEFDYDDGYATYEIDFETSTKEYEYEIDAKTGKIINSEVETERNNTSSSNTQNKTSNQVSNQHSQVSNQYSNVSNHVSAESASVISKTKAQSIALNHANVSNGYYDYNVELDSDNGVKVYEIDFETNSHEYEYKINATSGKILESDKERKGRED